jgi:hypothetical protein
VGEPGHELQAPGCPAPAFLPDHWAICWEREPLGLSCGKGPLNGGTQHTAFPTASSAAERHPDSAPIRPCQQLAYSNTSPWRKNAAQSRIRQPRKECMGYCLSAGGPGIFILFIPGRWEVGSRMSDVGRWSALVPYAQIGFDIRGEYSVYQSRQRKRRHSQRIPFIHA